MLHIRCGGDILEKLREGGVPGDFLVWADPVSQGPTPRDLAPDAWYEIRSAFIANEYGGDAADVAAGLREADAVLAAAGDQDELVLWFEHDLFDQAILIRLLAWLDDHGSERRRLSIVTLDAHPEVRRFIGLGNLDPRQLAALFPRRAPVTEAMLRIGRRAWAAYTAPTPEALMRLVASRMPELPYLPAALERHLRELPSVARGLSETEALTLEAVQAGAHTPLAAFLVVQDREAAPWLGDAMYYAVIARLASAAVPLLAVQGSWPSGDGGFGAAPLTITDAGRQVLAGRKDAVQLSGVERWVGGVRLSGARSEWRWDETSRRPVRA